MGRANSPLTEEEATRLYHLNSPKISAWFYWGVPTDRKPKLTRALMEQLREFQDNPDYYPLLCRNVGSGKIVAMFPELLIITWTKVAAKEGTVFIGVEGTDTETWAKATELYRLARKVFILRGRGDAPAKFLGR